MMPVDGAADPFGGRFDRPVFLLTSDQDWAPEWAVDTLFEDTLGHGIPLHLFQTNASHAVQAASAGTGLTIGIHPNFLPGSSHGSTPDDVIRHCVALAPGAATFRCHTFFENTAVLGRLFASGFRVDSNLGLFGQPNLVPLFHCTGILRLPVFFEDDVFYNLSGPALDLEPLRARLFSPGLKVINVHPSLIGLNAPSQAYYDGQRAQLYGAGGSASPFQGRGSRDVLRNLIAAVRAGGHQFESFEAVAAECAAQAQAHAARDAGLYGWGARSWAGTSVRPQPAS